jgi:hypothetical protein
MRARGERRGEKINIATMRRAVRLCRRCAHPTTRWRYCTACIPHVRRERQRHQPSRKKRRVCPACGRAMRIGSARCQKCARSRQLAACPRCGKEFWPWANGSHARQFCSGTCAASAMATLRWPRLNQQRETPRPRAVTSCAWCGATFKGSTTRQKFCSVRCNNIAKKKRRQARLREGGNPPSLAEIFLRDRGICQLCRRRVSRTRKWPHPLSASLDHIVPVSERPWDDARNIQLAHLRCNIRKQARRCGSQLRLIG